jgi:hypothetical protein
MQKTKTTVGSRKQIKERGGAENNLIHAPMMLAIRERIENINKQEKTK